MRLLITGGTGFIGSRLALRARALGHEVAVVGMTNTPAEEANRRELDAAGVGVQLKDLEEMAGTSELFRGVDAVIHLAAAQHEVTVPDEHFRKVNVEGTRVLMDAARTAGAGRFVYGSTIGVYGDRDGLLDEATPAAPDNVYGRSKLEAERLVLGRAGGQPVVVVRITETYGPGDRRLLKLFKALRKGRFFVIGNGRNLHHPAYVDDLADGLLLAALSPAALGDVFLLPGKDAVTTDEMVAAVAAAVGRPAPTVRAPLWPFMVAADVLERTLRPLGVQPPLHRRRMDFFKKSFRLSGEKAARVLGFTPRVGFREGAERTARWYEQVGEL
ncbi:MAG TPA: NAD-dependent epimerase/dehydratase family protein [Geminicoccaceae bacterium]